MSGRQEEAGLGLEGTTWSFVFGWIVVVVGWMKRMARRDKVGIFGIFYLFLKNGRGKSRDRYMYGHGILI